MKKIRLGELLLQQGLATKEQLEQAYQQQKETGEKLGRTLIQMGVINEESLLSLLATQLDLPYIKLADYDINKELALHLPETYARRFRAIILNQEGDGFLVGLSDPLDIYAVDELHRILNKPIKVAIVSETLLLKILDSVYRHTQEITNFADELSGELADETENVNLFDEAIATEDAPVVKLLNSLFKDAVAARASDIHIEPDEKVLRIRLRVDGLLQENILDDNRIARPLVQRLKMRANLDISEKRLPQDGRFQLNVKDSAFDVRISTLPVAFGESVVMRLLDQSAPVKDFSSLGMEQAFSERLAKIYNEPSGLLLVTGPTGSGKTTTLYSILSRLNKPDQKIITVEDPVEYKLPRINQVQVNPKIELDFSRVLRASLRQDPDVIMIGEIRDIETATIAMRAAVTGHFVMATLHTNDAMSSALRLIDMGGKGYMVASSLKGVLAQRLLRLICTRCAELYQPTEAELSWLAIEHNEQKPKISIKKAVGCNQCNQTGYQGRTGVYELLETNEAMAEALRNQDPQAFAKAVQQHPEFFPLKQRIAKLVLEGLTSIEEALRIVGGLV